MIKHAFFLLLLSISFLGLAQTRSVDYPVAGSRQTDVMEVYRVEISDTALVLTGEVYQLPGNWVSIASSSTLHGNTTGKTYRLIRSVGLDSDKRVSMPPSGKMPFLLQFEPVDPAERSVDFLETDAADGFRVKDIRLYPQEKKGCIRCRLEGTVPDTSVCSRLALSRLDADLRITDWISIPVRNGKFAYDLYTDTADVYELMPWTEYLNGTWHTLPFIAENGEIRFTVYACEHEPGYRTVTQLPLNCEMIQIKNAVDSLFWNPLAKEEERLQKAGLYQTAGMEMLHEQFKQEKNEDKRREIARKVQRLYDSGEAFVPEYRNFLKQEERTNVARRAYVLNYIRENPTLVGYYLMKSYLADPKANVDSCLYLFHTFYEKQFPGHPLTEEFRLFASSREIRPGGAYADFSAPDLQGIIHTLSKEIEGKIAVIDLWASWCMPCRRNSKSMIPVYEAYKERGFTVIGVAREKGNTHAMENAVRHDGYPWLNLVDLDDKLQIWKRYGIGNAGGSMFLVGRDGKIAVINPTDKEVEAYLKNALK